MVNQQVSPITQEEPLAKRLEALGVICTVFLGNSLLHLHAYQVLGLLKEANEVVAWL